MNQPNNTINSIVLAKYGTHAPSTSVKLKETSTRVARIAHAETTATRTFGTIARRTNSAIGEAAALLNNTSKEIRRGALPCPVIRGASYVKAEDVANVQEIFDEAEEELEVIKRRIVSQWPTLRTEAEQALGDLASEVEWPEAQDFADRFSIELSWLAIPAPVDDTVLGAVSDEVAARVRASSAGSVKDMFLEAHGAPLKELITQLAGTVKQMREGKRLCQARFDNIAAAAQRLHTLNWLQLPEVDQLVDELLSTIDVTDASALSSEQRVDVVDKVAAAEATARETLTSLGL